MEKSLKFMFPKNKTIKIFAVFALFIFINYTAYCQQPEVAAEPLSAGQIAAYKEQAIKSINDLEKFIKVIVDKKSDMESRNVAVEVALRLFQSDTATVQISNLNSSAITTHTIAAYLNRLRLLPYKSVKIQWYQIYICSTFTLGEDGNYYGTATYLQKFEGIGNKEMGNYTDITKRKITIILKKIDKAYEGANRADKYNLKLGDIQVEETKRG